MSSNSSSNFKELCDSVTSKKGTTEAGLDVLKKNDSFQKIMTKTIKAASKRSKELSREE